MGPRVIPALLATLLLLVIMLFRAHLETAELKAARVLTEIQEMSGQGVTEVRQGLLAIQEIQEVQEIQEILELEEMEDLQARRGKEAKEA
jgi:hypothetical protein